MTAAGLVGYQGIAATLASYSDTDLAALVETGEANSVGVGGSSVVLDVDDVAVFAKLVPLTDLERANPHSTANLFDLPVYCQYGIGGPGFNAWRELAANMIVTDAVLAGETQSFPMLYHWRVLPGRSLVADEHTDVDAVVAAFGDHAAVRTRLGALAAASCSLVLFSEYIPRPIEGWLRENPAGKATAVERQFSQIVKFLGSRELLHMDAHFGNMRVDGDRIFLSDFGLVTSRRFDLSSDEQAFVDRHATHDARYASMRLVNWLVTEVCGVPTPTSGGPVARNEYVVQCAAGHIPDNVPPAVATILKRHAPAAAKMNAFYWRLFDGEIHAEYPG